MRFYRDDPRTATVQYFFVDDAPFVPHVNAFVSSIWDSEDRSWPTLGEVAGSSSGWLNGEAPVGLPPPDQRVACGTAEQWLRGDSLPPAVPVALLPNGMLAECAMRQRRVAFPFNVNFWVSAGDVPGPEDASAGTWKDRGSSHDDATQDDAGEWPSKTFEAPYMPVAVRFQPGESMELKKPLVAPAWTLWAVFSGQRGSEPIVSGPEPDGFPKLVMGSTITFGIRSVAFSVGTLVSSPIVGTLGPDFTGAVIARVTYDGSDLTLTCFGDIEGTSTRHHPGVEYPISFLGESGFPATADTNIGDVMWWDRVLTDEENAEILRYLENKYVPSRFFIVTESGDRITTESGDQLITE